LNLNFKLKIIFMNNHLLIKKRLRYTKFIGLIIARLPYIGCVILTGSLARGNANQNSDIDIMIIARAGRIFSARFFVNTFGTIFGMKRSKDETKNHAGKFCFNYFVSDNYLMLPTGRGEKIDRYCAEDYSRSKFMAGDYQLHEEFLYKNRKLFNQYGHSIKLDRFTPTHQCVNINRQTPYTTSRFERWVRQYQIRKIESDPITKKYPNLIVYNDKELRFHPPSLKLRRTSPPKKRGPILRKERA